MRTRGKKKILCFVLFLLSLTILILGCDRLNETAIKVNDPPGINNEPVIHGEQLEEGNKSSGVLLGIKSEKKDDRGNYYSSGTGIMAINNNPQYKTLYITNNKGNITLSAQGSGILVPRNDDFWLLNIETERLEDKYKDFDYESNIEYITAKKANSSSVKESIKKNNSGELAKKWCEYYYSGDPQEFDNNVFLELTFVGNDYITQHVVVDGYVGGFQPYIRHWLMTIPFGETNKIDVFDDHIREFEGRAVNTEVKGVSISELFGNNVEAQFLKEGNEYIKNENLTLDNEGLINGYFVQGEKHWGFFRQNGKWVVKGYLKNGFGTGRYLYGIFDTDIIPPKQIVSHDTLIPDWNVIKTSIPDAKDAFSSPEKDMLVVLTSKELRVYTDFKDDYIGEVAYVIDLGDIIDSEEEKEVDVIMAQWATGNYIEKWANAARTYLKNN